MAFDKTKPADTEYISASAVNLRENFRALAEDTRLYGTGAPESSAGQNGWRYVDTATGDEYLKVNDAWIKKTDLAALIAALLSDDVYKQSNIIGTVGQSLGVPTGAVIERGSNANGEYVKFADGTMMCRWKPTFISITIAPLTASGPHPWIYPAVFINLVNLVVSVYYAGAYANSLRACVGGVGASELNAYVVNGDTIATLTTTPDDILMFLAIGRWF